MAISAALNSFSKPVPNISEVLGKYKMIGFTECEYQETL